MSSKMMFMSDYFKWKVVFLIDGMCKKIRFEVTPNRSVTRGQVRSGTRRLPGPGCDPQKGCPRRQDQENYLSLTARGGLQVATDLHRARGP